MFIDHIYQLLGQSLLTIIFIILILIITALLLGKYIIQKEDRIIFPRFIIFVIDIFYLPIKKLCRIFNIDDTIVDEIGVNIRNKINRSQFIKIPANKTLIFLPHCLRHIDCKAHLQKDGLICTECGKCSIGIIKKKAEILGYKIYIVPGSSFIKNIVKKSNFEAVIGIACYEDLNQTMMNLSKFHPQGAVLTKTGCFETKVDIKSALEIINSKISDQNTTTNDDNNDSEFR